MEQPLLFIFLVQSTFPSQYMLQVLSVKYRCSNPFQASITLHKLKARSFCLLWFIVYGEMRGLGREKRSLLFSWGLETFFKDLFNHVYADSLPCVWIPWEARALGFHGAAATGSCEPPEMGAGNSNSGPSGTVIYTWLLSYTYLNSPFLRFFFVLLLFLFVLFFSWEMDPIYP